MKKVIFTALLAFSLTAFQSPQKEIPTIEWVTICTGTDPSTGTQLQLKSNGRGVNMLVKADKYGQPTADAPVTTNMDKQKFKEYCEDHNLTTNC